MLSVVRGKGGQGITSAPVLPVADEGQGQLFHARTLGWLIHIPATRVSATVLGEVQGSLPSVATNERWGQFCIALRHLQGPR